MDDAIEVVAEAVASYVTPLQLLANQIIQFIPLLVIALLVFTGFWIASIIAGRLINNVGGRSKKLDPVVRKLVSDAVRITILVIGGITALGTINVDVSALVAGLGLASLGLGLALRDVIGNAVSCMMILMYQPFRVNDTIKIGEHEGRVIDVDLRYTTLQVEEKKILIPNQIVFAQVVIVDRSSRSARVR